MERIPTASVLLRIMKAPRSNTGKVLGMDDFPQEQWEEKGVLIPSPAYNQGIYSTNYYRNTPLEKRLWELRVKRKDPKMEELKDSLLAVSNQNRRMENQLFFEWFESLVDRAGEDLPMLDMNYFSYYNPEIGFRVGVECLHQLNYKEKGYFAVIASISPPGSFYKLDRNNSPNDVINAFTDIDWNSYNTSIKFKEGMYTEENVEPLPGKCIVFDVKKMN